MINCRNKCKYNTRIDSTDRTTGFCEKNQEEFYLCHNISDCPLYRRHDCLDCKNFDIDVDNNEDEILLCLEGHCIQMTKEQPDDCKEFESVW